MCAFREWNFKFSWGFTVGRVVCVPHFPFLAEPLIVEGRRKVETFQTGNILEVGRFQTRLIQSLDDSNSIRCPFVGLRLNSS